MSAAAPDPALWLSLDEFARQRAGLPPDHRRVIAAKLALMSAGMTEAEIGKLRFRSLPEGEAAP